ncbi:MAG: triose-phosphate isomerase [Rugosibacter sp.]|jgi:triosephosphate isomerase|nr:triose-phosphate isomerase [Rugosibacter sp.]MDO9271989.1 triose-phosphate isomerase [Rugosibacter sp.]
MRNKLVVGNWKMHGRLATNPGLLDAIRSGISTQTAKSSGAVTEAALCLPYPYLAQARQSLEGSSMAWGAQDVSEHDQGAWTGEVSGSMLDDFGCRYVLVGHSERRSFFAETDAIVAAKFAAAQRAGLIPILCVGETLVEREAGVTHDVITRQLDAVLAVNGSEAFARAVVAYEPVWAIGTGKTATPAQAQEVHAAIRGRLACESADLGNRLQILYGGSVKPSNAAEIFSQPDIDGGLIGGASLVAVDFLAICAAA